MLTADRPTTTPGSGRTRRERVIDSGLGRWTRRRPFVGGALMVIGGLVVTVFPFLPVKNHVTAGVAIGWYDPEVGLTMVHPPLGLVGGIALVVCGVLTLRRPGAHRVVGMVGVGAALASFVLNHLGGFVVGMLLGILGGALTWSWLPGPRSDDGHEPLTDPEFFSLVNR